MRFVTVLALLALGLPAFAGGFFIELGNPSASKDPAAKEAFLLARLVGCHQPEKGTVTASAEGIVKGKRQSVQLKVIPLRTPGLFAVTRSWPSDGKWIIHLSGAHPDINVSTTTLVKVRGDTYDRGSAKLEMKMATKEEIDRELASFRD